MDQIALVSVAFGDSRYLDQMQRLLNSIHIYEPNSAVFTWVNEMPSGAKSHTESYYGFKVHAINHARSLGYTKIIWFDPAVYLVSPLTEYWELVKQYGVIAAKDDNKLTKFTTDKQYEHFESTRLDYMHLVGGSVYVFDFELGLCNAIFNEWANAEATGLFHEGRNDESCMALALYACGSEPTPYDIARYNDVPDALVKKQHFK